MMLMGRQRLGEFEGIGTAQQLTQQRGDRDDRAPLRPPGDADRFDVEAPGRDIEEPHEVLGLGGDEHRLVGRHRPRPLLGLDEHDSRRAVEQLRSPVAVIGQHRIGRIPGPDRQHLPGVGVDVIDGWSAHDSILVAKSRKNATECRLPA